MPETTPPLSSPSRAARVLVLVAHPQLQHSRVNRRLAQAAQALAATGTGAQLTVRDLYSNYPDHFIDVAAEQQAASAADLIVWQHPVHWYSMPALMKLWVDEVLARGWAYGPGGTALRGKYLWPVLSTGGPEASYADAGYNRHPFDAFLPPYRQTAALCGLHFVDPLVLHGAHTASDIELAQHVQRYEHALSSFPDWPAHMLRVACPECQVPAADRPSAE